MGDVLVENSINNVPPHKKAAPSTIPSIENFEGVSTDAGDDYANLKKLQRQLEYIQLQEEYIKDEQRYAIALGEFFFFLASFSSCWLITYHLICRSLKRELVRAQEEIKRIQSVPLVIGQFMEAIDQK